MSAAMWPFKPKPQIDRQLKEAQRLAFTTMIDSARIYFWAESHKVDLRANKKRLLKDGLIYECVFRDLSIKDAIQRHTFS